MRTLRGFAFLSAASLAGGIAASTIIGVAPVNAVDTAMTISTTAIDFGSVQVGTTASASVILTNTGGTPFGPINMFGGAPPTAEFNGSQNCQGATLPPGGSCMVTYSFTPGVIGAFSDVSNFTISPTASQSNGEDFSVSLSGIGGAGPGPAIESLVPTRLGDTRPGAPTFDGQFAGQGLRAAGTIWEVQVRGRGGVPNDAEAVLLNVTAVDPQATGHLTVFPCAAAVPLASNLNYRPGQVVPNAVLARIGTNGRVCIFTLSASHIVVDVSGFVPANGSPDSLVPARLGDTRPGAPTFDGQFAGQGLLAGGTTWELQVTGRGNVPNGATTVLLNVTAIDPQSTGYLTVFPCGTPLPLASNVNYEVGQVVANAVLARIGTSGRVCIFTLAGTHLAVDVNGYVLPGGAPTSLVPARLGDTRPSAPTFDGQFSGQGLRAAGSTFEVQVRGRGGVPNDATAALLNVTAVDPLAAGYLTVFPCGAALPLASNVNFQAGQVVPNAVLARIGANGRVCIFTLAATHVVVDVSGFVAS